MGRFIKLLVFLVVVAGGLFLFSYAGARLSAGKVLGSDLDGLGSRTMTFDYDGIEGIRGKPRGWTVAYGPATVLGLREVRIFVSPTGELLGTNPADLAARMQSVRNRDP